MNSLRTKGPILACFGFDVELLPPPLPWVLLPTLSTRGCSILSVSLFSFLRSFSNTERFVCMCKVVVKNKRVAQSHSGSEVTCCCLLLSVVVCCCLLLSVVVCCCLLLFVVVCCCLLLFVVVCCCLLLSVVVCCCLLLFVFVVVIILFVCCLLFVVCCSTRASLFLWGKKKAQLSTTQSRK